MKNNQQPTNEEQGKNEESHLTQPDHHIEFKQFEIDLRDAEPTDDPSLFRVSGDKWKVLGPMTNRLEHQ